MCTVTLSYDRNNAMAQQQLSALLASGLFTQLETQNGLGIDYNDPWLYENHEDLTPLPETKETYTLEELRSILINDLNEVYGVKDEV